MTIQVVVKLRGTLSAARMAIAQVNQMIATVMLPVVILETAVMILTPFARVSCQLNYPFINFVFPKHSNNICRYPYLLQYYPTSTHNKDGTGE